MTHDPARRAPRQRHAPQRKTPSSVGGASAVATQAAQGRPKGNWAQPAQRPNPSLQLGAAARRHGACRAAAASQRSQRGAWRAVACAGRAWRGDRGSEQGARTLQVCAAALHCSGVIRRRRVVRLPPCHRARCGAAPRIKTRAALAGAQLGSNATAGAWAGRRAAGRGARHQPAKRAAHKPRRGVEREREVRQTSEGYFRMGFRKG